MGAIERLIETHRPITPSQNAAKWDRANAQYDAEHAAAQTTAPFDADGRPDKFHTFSGARDAAETPNPPRVSRMQRLAQLRGMTDGPT